MTASLATVHTSPVTRVVGDRRRRRRRRRTVLIVLFVAVVGTWAVSLMVGQTVHTPAEVLAVLQGHDVPGASFTVGRLRLPRASLGLVAGMGFGLSGSAFQTLLRNPLASPDIIGISWGASTAAAFAIVVLGLSGPVVSLIAVVAGLGVALAIHVLSSADGAMGMRLVLVGIGIAAMLNSVLQWVLLQANAWDYQSVLRWLTGSLNGTVWAEVVPTAVALVVLAPVLFLRVPDLRALELGDDTASALGVRVPRTRLVVLVAAVGLVSFATAGAGPVAFVAFLSGPIAARLLGPNGSLLLPAGLVGALLVLLADLAGQHAIGTRFPVGVVTGVVGAPYLLSLVGRTTRIGGRG